MAVLSWSPALACPVCKGGLRARESALHCGACTLDYAISLGVPCLLPPATGETVDSGRLHMKTWAESAATRLRDRVANSGFLTSQRHFYAIYFAMLVAALLRQGWLVGALLALLFVDWLVFRARRARILREYEANPVRLRTLADYEAVDRIYSEAGVPQQTMADCSRLEWEAAGVVVSEDHWKPQVAERYLEILEVYRTVSPPPAVVVDVGANDGQSCHEFGIGRGARFIGIDVSGLLLRDLLEKLPDESAAQGDGACLPLRDESVDFLFCTETLEHLSDPWTAAHEFLRVLKPGGLFMVQSPNAHRIRNLNLFEFLVLAYSLIDDRVLQKKIVHENTWHSATTYHWDFSVHDYRKMIQGRSARFRELRSREFFFPQFLLRGPITRFRAKERVFRRLPILKYFGGDLVMVVEKLR